MKIKSFLTMMVKLALLIFALPVLMVATPQYGTMLFRGMRSMRTYVKDVYVSDVAGALVNFDGGAGASASSPTEWTPPEPVILQDWSVVTGLADTTKLQIARNGIPSGDMLRHAIHLTTLNNRPALTIGFRGGTRVTAIQQA